MIVFSDIKNLQEYLISARKTQQSIGFVPTMGALHEGHLSLVKTAKNNHDIAVVSIFVNPTQFNDKEDFINYPITREADISLLESQNCDVAFIPEVKEIYPDGIHQHTLYDLGEVEYILEGAIRPGHFQGVAQVVSRLLDIVEPDKMYLGQKDYQQCIILKKLLHILRKQDVTVIDILPTKREPDGLAMSSRNRRLTEPQRAVAGTIYQCLVSIQSKQSHSSFEFIKNECLDLLQAKGFVPEYISLADADDLTLMDDFDLKRKMIVLIAAKIGNVRLIDNMLL